MSVLRVFVLCLVGVAAVSLYCVCLGAAESQPPAAKTPDLLQRVAALEERVAQLEKKLAEQTLPAYPAMPPGVTAVPGLKPAQPLPLTPGVPPNAVPHTFNGQTFYIVPLGKEAAR